MAKVEISMRVVGPLAEHCAKLADDVGVSHAEMVRGLVRLALAARGINWKVPPSGEVPPKRRAFGPRAAAAGPVAEVALPPDEPGEQPALAVAREPETGPDGELIGQGKLTDVLGMLDALRPAPADGDGTDADGDEVDPFA